jgi:hypothetical protein
LSENQLLSQKPYTPREVNILKSLFGGSLEDQNIRDNLTHWFHYTDSLLEQLVTRTSADNEDNKEEQEAEITSVLPEKIQIEDSQAKSNPPEKAVSNKPKASAKAVQKKPKSKVFKDYTYNVDREVGRLLEDFDDLQFTTEDEKQDAAREVFDAVEILFGQFADDYPDKISEIRQHRKESLELCNTYMAEKTISGNGLGKIKKTKKKALKKSKQKKVKRNNKYIA